MALVLVAIVSVLIGLVIGQTRTRIANISMFYLVAILVAAVLFGRGPAILASIAAFLVFDWFFVEPVHNFTIADPEEYVALLLFLVTATVTGTVAALQHARAEEAVAREREARVLSDVVRVLAEPEVDAALHAAASRLREELRLAAVAIHVELPDLAREVALGDPESVAALRAATGGAGRILGGGSPSAEERSRPGRWVRIVAPYRGARVGPRERARVVPAILGDRRIASLVLLPGPSAPPFDAADDRLLAAAAAQIAVALERARLRKAANEAELLRRTDELKTALLGAVSHDLRTPLASIIAGAGSLRQRDVTWTDDERVGLASDIEEQARRLDRVVGDLLDLSRIEAGALVPRKGWYDAGSLVDDVVGRLRRHTSEHRVSVRVPDDLPPVELDYVEIAQALGNLVENAAKFAPRGSEIEVSVRAEPGVLRFEVADHGPGLPAGEASRVFQPFYRVGRDLTTRGTGLGLAIARRLVEAHGGRIGVEPRTGGGSRFFFTVPA